MVFLLIYDLCLTPWWGTGKSRDWTNFWRASCIWFKESLLINCLKIFKTKHISWFLLQDPKRPTHFISLRVGEDVQKATARLQQERRFCYHWGVVSSFVVKDPCRVSYSPLLGGLPTSCFGCESSLFCHARRFCCLAYEKELKRNPAKHGFDVASGVEQNKTNWDHRSLFVAFLFVDWIILAELTSVCDPLARQDGILESFWHYCPTIALSCLSWRSVRT